MHSKYQNLSSNVFKCSSVHVTKTLRHSNTQTLTKRSNIMKKSIIILSLIIISTAVLFAGDSDKEKKTKNTPAVIKSEWGKSTRIISPRLYIWLVCVIVVVNIHFRAFPILGKTRQAGAKIVSLFLIDPA